MLSFGILRHEPRVSWEGLKSHVSWTRGPCYFFGFCSDAPAAPKLTLESAVNLRYSS
jgi:hypothetical protein